VASVGPFIDSPSLTFVVHDDTELVFNLSLSSLCVCLHRNKNDFDVCAAGLKQDNFFGGFGIRNS
jgi:hypothetical protein